MLDWNKIQCYPIRERVNKFTLADLIPIDNQVVSPDPQIDAVARAVADAKQRNAKVIVMIGGAVIKTGCSLLLIDLLQHRLIDHLALNGGASIHDFEIGLIGATSENVQNGLATGKFGMVHETLTGMNEAINTGSRFGWGYGQSIGEHISRQDFPYKTFNLLYNCHQLGIPGTVHIAIGGDIIHQHPSCNGAALGSTSYQDFKILTESVAGLNHGVLLNIGSAVNLPEVFLKAITIVRNLGLDVGQFTTANFDFLDMYRPRTRIVEWPQSIGCQGYDIRAAHPRSVPTLHRLIKHYLEQS